RHGAHRSDDVCRSRGGIARHRSCRLPWARPSRDVGRSAAGAPERMMRTWLISIVLAMLPFEAGGPTPADGPRFDGDKLLPPAGYDMWPIVGASIGLSYSKRVEGSDPGTFHRVYVNPTAYATFRGTGTFPNGTIFVLELHEAASKTSPAEGGYFEG